MEITGATNALLTVVSPDTTRPALPAASPDSLAASRFAAIMNGDSPTAVPTATLIPPEAQASPTTPASSLGDRILNGLSGLSTDFQQSWKNVNAVLDGGNTMTTSDMLKLQMSLTQMSIQYDLVGKAISRSTQNIEQLVKIQ